MHRVALVSSCLLVSTFGLVTGLQATASAASRPTCFGKRATIVGTPRNDTIHGTKGNDVIYAGNGNDIVYGGGGNDLICGGYGADRLHGGPGNDWIEGDLGAKVHTSQGIRIDGDVLFGDGGNDFFSPGFDKRHPTRTPDKITYYYSKKPVTVNTLTHSATGEGRDTWLGDRAEIIGSSKGDTFIGGPGNDTFQGAGGADTMSGGAGDDVLRDDYPGKTNKDRDRLNGGPGNDQLFTQGGFDRLDGGLGDDLLSDYSHYAGTMRGGPGNDQINDDITVNPNQVIDGGPGVDTVRLTVDFTRLSWPRLAIDLSRGVASFRTSPAVRFKISSADKLYVQGLPLTYIGDAGDNFVWTDGMGDLDATGNAGNDTFVGSTANDNFNGGPGTDRVTTNGGHDTCHLVEQMVGTCHAG